MCVVRAGRFCLFAPFDLHDVPVLQGEMTNSNPEAETLSGTVRAR